MGDAADLQITSVVSSRNSFEVNRPPDSLTSILKVTNLTNISNASNFIAS